ncbi:putative Dihydrodipicolinate synthetase [Vibrio nigripulchritudo SFn27]|uniref:Putative Dihydrodipicolinate synthetase n=1 Tax=Vibrio nigripulchritudo TaxID=28173 RepID=U4K433_9VIBR|nr:dihydrodipicolinate synthase family protein [Vibrio nigripulchritudo]CCN85596.1 putative Dihydrodipicolinate synthetase [Vibrio nigripulchritudo BLFn1]CCN87483.1 putative Dihydrodipicolinate synthetase [Vibrio nigripulchritudo SFn27]CCN94862.1 putative Dihydrodipicolinate synthetase [Vibrio nigripulchritudo ENn2]CCO40598.1 putative Dihydrodipicolinate synthetase [Vibrio nigripulchritudo SFn135]CCO54675.1 putative Dihydrodipicolinate synthetase [Vibrio nigripulchritudo Wn13]
MNKVIPRFGTNDIVGVNPVLAMPFTQNGDVDYKSFDRLVEHLIQTGCHGMTLFGIASEFYKLTFPEKEELALRFLKNTEHSNVYRCLSVTDHATEVAVQTAQHYQSLGADVLMLLPPYFLNPQTWQIEEHIEAVLSSVSIPVLIQYAPTETGVPIPPEKMAAWGKKYPNAMFKVECNPPVEYGQTLLSMLPDATLLNGYAGLYMLDMMSIGGKGVMPGSSFAEVYVDIYNLWQSGQHQAAKDKHQQLLTFIEVWMSNCEYLIDIEKKILAKRNVIQSDYCRKPGYPTSEKDNQQIEEFFQLFGLG